jgi:hypothetical protein
MRPRWLALGTLLVMGIPAVSLGEVPAVMYDTEIPGYYIPHAHDIVVDGDGNAYMIGAAYEDGHSLDVLVAKVGAKGGVAWLRYIVSSAHNDATGIALGQDGNVWVTGWTDSPDFPLVDPIRSTFQAREVFLMQLSKDDGSTLYSTFIGGDYADQANGIAVNAAGEIILAGETGSTDYPTTPDAYQGEPSFPLYFFSDAFITKLSPDGKEIRYSTYFGGQEDDRAQRIALDAAGNIIIAGHSEATDFPLVNPLQSTHDDIFISKLSADGSTLLFSTFFGGEDADNMTGLATDGAGNLYLTGSTQSVAFPTTPGAYQEEFVGAINGCEVPFGGYYNCEDFYVTKMADDGSGLVWSTYLGGTKPDQPRAVAVDDEGRVYVAGYTTSPDFPLDGSLFSAQIVVCRLSADGSNLDYTYTVDSGSANRGNGVVVDSHGDVYFTGTVGVPASILISKLQGSLRATSVNPGVIAGPQGLALGSGTPNPFNQQTAISYSIPPGSQSPVSLRVYDARGRLVRQLVNEVQSGGEHTIEWSGRNDGGADVAGGVYFYRLQWEGHSLTQRGVLTR